MATEVTAGQVVILTRPSRSGGHQHVIYLDAATGTPFDLVHPCSCAAGADGRYCWALLEVLRDEAPQLVSGPGVQARGQLAGQILARQRRWS